jgi:Protein of unknown function (DUF2892)
MQKNIGTADRLLRFLIGVFFLILAWWQSSWIALAIAFFTFYEAFASWCILYQILGKSSCPINRDK